MPEGDTAEAVLAATPPQTVQTVAAPRVDADLLKRVETLEQELKRVKKALRHEHKLLSRAVLLQLGMEDDDDLD